MPEDQVLFEKYKIQISSKNAINDINEISDEVSGLIRPKPNTTVLGHRFGLWAKYKSKEEKPNFFIKYLDKKIGEEPVFLSDISINKTENRIQNRLENRGYYNSIVQIEKNKSNGKITCNILLTKPYTIKSYQVVSDSLAIYREIAASLSKSKLKVGEQFNLAQIKTEKERINADLKAKGYYNFNGDYLIFEVDTNQNEKNQFNLFIRLKKNVPRKAIIPYQLNKILIYPNHSISSVYQNVDTTVINGVNFLQDTLYFLPSKLEPFLLFSTNDYFNPGLSRGTANRLSAIGSYKLVNIQFEELVIGQNDKVGKLNTMVYLTPLNKRALRFELKGETKSNGFTGPALTMTHTNRNLFKGGEILNLSAEVGFEKQFLSEDISGLNSTQLGFKADLLFPRLISPVQPKNNFSYAIPKTKVSTGIEFLNRSKLYQLTSFNASFGYFWRSNKQIYQEINPISINYVQLSNASTEFNTILNNNSFLKNSFEQELIAGINYNYTYSELNNPQKKSPLFFSTSVDVVGNGLSLVNTGSNSKGNQTVLGIEYAQYVKIDMDLRYFLRVGKEQVLANRLFIGCGIPYGNSTTLPFSRQYYSGGPYSIRAFRSRSLGPGTFLPSNDNSAFFAQSGDIQFEANLEYRFPIVSFVKGAVFVDGGNVWLKKENGAVPGGQFTPSFINELAIGAGTGIRFDIQGFVIRIDLATPIQKPYLPKGDRLGVQLNETILNFALGYPF
ncbi:MAG: BamA/TamA family outer membrane protein [Flavobacteriales bacterium]|nr:BamA/TamA family outer membrane protein [Flavobacteriales bacterium]